MRNAHVHGGWLQRLWRENRTLFFCLASCKSRWGGGGTRTIITTTRMEITIQEYNNNNTRDGGAAVKPRVSGGLSRAVTRRAWMGAINRVAALWKAGRKRARLNRSFWRRRRRRSRTSAIGEHSEGRKYDAVRSTRWRHNDFAATVYTARCAYRVVFSRRTTGKRLDAGEVEKKKKKNGNEYHRGKIASPRAADVITRARCRRR